MHIGHMLKEVDVCRTSSGKTTCRRHTSATGTSGGLQASRCSLASTCPFSSDSSSTDAHEHDQIAALVRSSGEFVVLIQNAPCIRARRHRHLHSTSLCCCGARSHQQIALQVLRLAFHAACIGVHGGKPSSTLPAGHLRWENRPVTCFSRTSVRIVPPLTIQCAACARSA